MKILRMFFLVSLCFGLALMPIPALSQMAAKSVSILDLELHLRAISSAQIGIKLYEHRLLDLISRYDSEHKQVGAAFKELGMTRVQLAQNLSHAYLRSAAYYYGGIIDGVYTSYYLSFFLENFFSGFMLGVEAGVFSETPDSQTILELFTKMKQQDRALEITLKLLRSGTQKEYEVFDDFRFCNLLINASYLFHWTNDIEDRPVGDRTMRALQEHLQLTSLEQQVVIDRPRSAYLAMAQLCLAMLGRHPVIATQIVGYLQKALFAARINLKQLGFTKDKLTLCVREANKDSARWFVQLFRKKQANEKALAYCIYVDSLAANIPLEKLGLTPAEVKTIKRLALTVEVRERKRLKMMEQEK
jgi:hypothetical protein